MLGTKPICEYKAAFHIARDHFQLFAECTAMNFICLDRGPSRVFTRKDFS